MKNHDWNGFKVVISRQSHVTLRRPSGRSVAWFGSALKDVDGVAREALATYPGTVLVDKRVNAEAVGMSDKANSDERVVETKETP